MNKVLDTTKYVVENSVSVQINHSAVLSFSNTFKEINFSHWLSSAPFDFSHFSDNKKLNFLFVFNAMSFCYWGDPKWTIEYNGKEFDGAWGMITALGKGVESGMPILDFKYCSKISKEDFTKLLKANVDIPLIEERWKILREISTTVNQKYNGQLENIIHEAKGNALAFLDLIISNFPSFIDKSVYKEKEVFFHKRAQLLIADIYQIFRGKGLGELEDINKLTACADYKLPQMLRKVGILSYSDDLAQKIDSKIEIIHGSTEEVEIRANTIWAVEIVKLEIKKKIPSITSNDINDYLWLLSQTKFPDDLPYHRTRTTAY